MNRLAVEQFTTLVRHFFGRFFDNEFVAKNTDMQVTVVIPPAKALEVDLETRSRLAALDLSAPEAL